MNKAKINYYLLAIFIILLLANIYFYYFFKDGNKVVLANPSSCEGFGSCQDAGSCDSAGGPGGNLQLTDFKVQTFLCGEGVDWSQDPWVSAKNDGKPNTNITPPPTTTPSHQTCNVTNINEPINVIAKASSTNEATLWIQFIDPQNNTKHQASTTVNRTTNLTAFYSPSSPGTWTVQASVCEGSSQPNISNTNCVISTTSVKVYRYQCGSPLGGSPGICYAVSEQNFFPLYKSLGNWCGWWLNENNGEGCASKVR